MKVNNKSIDDIEEKLRNDGLLLKTIPSKERTIEQCEIAVHQNVDAFKYVPSKLQSIDICKYALKREPSLFKFVSKRLLSNELYLYAVKLDGNLLAYIDDFSKTKELCKVALENSFSSIRYVPISFTNEIYPKKNDGLVLLSLNLIKTNLDYFLYLPDCVKCDHDILRYLKECGCLEVLKCQYDIDINFFKVVYRFIDSNSYYVYEDETFFDDFNELYKFLDCDLNGVIFLGFDFKNIDLSKYDIKGAVIESNILEKFGLYNSDYYIDNVSNITFEEIIFDNEIALKDNCYLKPVEDEGNSPCNVDTIPIFYVSDIHIEHRVKHRFKNKATKEEVHFFIKTLVQRMINSVGTIPLGSLLLIAGDTSDNFDFLETFFVELIKLWNPKRIVVISGNHELWDPNEKMEDNIKFYRKFFSKLDINYLQNDLLCIEANDIYNHRFKTDFIESFILKGSALLSMPDEELYNSLLKCPLIIMGGIGFSSFNEKFNSINIDFGFSFNELSNDERRAEEIKQSMLIENIYNRLLRLMPKNNMIILTHTPFTDWCNKQYNKNWIYVSGHNHRNFFEDSDERRIFSDNQIGYRTENVGLKYFYVNNNYDTFCNYSDGIYDVTTSSYIQFNKGKRIECNFCKDGIIKVIKRNDYYMFFIMENFRKGQKIKFFTY